MADSDGSLSVYLSSDIDIDRPCELCFKAGNLRESVGYCPKCVEFFCENCLRAHRLSILTKHHTIERGNKMPKSISDVPVKFQICDKHKGELKDIYCLNHASVICPICSVKDHVKCNKKPVPEACESFNITSEEETFSKEIRKFLEYAKSVETSVTGNINRLATQHDHILKKAKAHRDKIIKHVNQSFQEFSTEITKIIKEQKTILTDKQSVLDHVLVELSSTLRSLQQSAKKKQNDQKRFLDLHNYTENILVCKTEINDLNLKVVDMKCIFNYNIHPLVESESWLGKLSLHNSLQHDMSLPCITLPCSQFAQNTVQAAQKLFIAVDQPRSLPKMLTCVDKIYVKLNDDRNDCQITGIGMTVDGNILLADLNNSTIKLFSPAGKLLSFLKLADKPEDVTVMNRSEAAVSMREKGIGILGITDRLSMKRTINSKYSISKITAYDNNLIVTCGSKCTGIRDSVQMIDMTGKVIWTVTRDKSGRNLFYHAAYLTTRSSDDGDTVIVTDCNRPSIIVLDVKTGDVSKVIYTKKRVPEGIAVDDNGVLYVCYKPGKISVWFGNIEEERRLKIETKRCTFDPFNMVYDHRRKEFLMIKRSCNLICQYKLTDILS